MTIVIELPEPEAERLAQEARRRNTTVEALAVEGVRSLIPEPSGSATVSDAEFEKIADYVFQKNAELMRRLA